MSDEKTAPVQESTQPASEVKPDAVAATAAPATEAKSTPEASAKPEGEKEQGTKATDESKERIVPEKYELSLSENSPLDKVLVEKISAYAKANGLTQDEATALLKQQEADVTSFIDAKKASWLEQTTNDKELGGEALKENIALSTRVLDRFGSDALKSELNKTGYGNHPEMVRLLTRIGKQMADDKFIQPGPQVNERPPIENRLYPNQK